MIFQDTLFNIPFWKIRIINFEEKKKELTKLLESYPEERKGAGEFSTNRFPQNFSSQKGRAGYPFIERFSSIMKEEFETLSKEIKKDFAIVDLWSVSYNKGDNQSPHNHASTGLTGILYLNLPKNSPVTIYVQPWNNYEIDAVQYASPSIAAGDIVIVPSFVLHFSKPNKSNSKKRIISWDMKILLKGNDE